MVCRTCSKQGPNLVSSSHCFTEASHVHYLSGKSCRLSCQPSALSSCCPSRNLIKEFLEFYFNQWAETAQFNWSYRAVSSFASFLTNQSSFVTINQDVRFRPIRIVLFGPVKRCIFWIPHLCKHGPSRDQGGHVLCISRTLLWGDGKHTFRFLGGCVFWFTNYSPE